METTHVVLEPICVLCGQEFRLRGDDQTGCADAICTCRTLRVSYDVFAVLDVLSTAAEKSLLINGYVKVQRCVSGSGSYASVVVDVGTSVARVKAMAKDMPQSKQGVLITMRLMDVHKKKEL